jgi:hypothetical protein
MKAHVGTASPGRAAVVVDLADARDGRRLRDLRSRLRASLDRNKRALARLFHSGLLYTRTGARLGRELLLAHQHLLRAGDLLARVDEAGGKHDPETELAARQVLQVLDRTGELYARSDGLLAREP